MIKHIIILYFLFVSIKSEEITNPEKAIDSENIKYDHIYALTTDKEEIEIYDVLQNMSKVESFNLPKVKDFKTAVINNEIYLIGGSNDGLSKSVYKFNPSTRNWTQINSMNFNRINNGVAVHGDKIYITGGFLSEKKFEYFDAKTDKWEILSELSTPIMYQTTVCFKDYIYMLGGLSQIEIKNNVEKYNLNKSEWSSSAPMLSPRAYFGVAILNDKIYAVGGWNGEKYVNTGEVYDYLNDSWTAIASMNETRNHFGLIAYDNKLYAIGGDDNNSIEIYDPVDNHWEYMNLPSGIVLGETVANIIKLDK